MFGLIKNALVIFFKGLLGIKEPVVPLSTQAPTMTHAYVNEPEVPRREYNLRARKTISYVEDSD